MILDGGLEPGSVVIHAGAPGTGKTIMAQQICFANATPEHKAVYYTTLSESHSKLVRHLVIAEGLERDERCLCVTFQDTPDQLVGRATGFGWDLDAARAADQLAVAHVPVGELDLDTLAAGIINVLATRNVRRVVIDSLAELVSAARETERFPAFARSLAGIVRSAGASLLITSQTTTIGEAAEPWEGLMFLFHNVVLLRYVELDSRVGRALNIIKMRNSRHDMGLYQFDIGDHGLTIGDQLEHTTGTLGWGPLRAKG